VFLSLKKALTKSIIKKGFSVLGIFPLDEHAVDSMLAPSDSFRGNVDSGEGGPKCRQGRVALTQLLSVGGSAFMQAGACCS
jgi:hypothetical protein